ncbi:hypothetical protein QR90_13240 [Deinococcus radiopugnans]|uniref:Uncharacterized protein n=2 Tax=Deinococcus radiopugnans TaxID=57497 RepID=A0A0A7KMI9_9DEIO|nr:hypothetical protein [Deinococcus radiopugnans]AIZ45828.1 hypothetical protein QR90_13240 [Deinococcus radiopugnans]MBB6015699.1 hypothetical protein [Deinococcus radiopugnans ATCC 19172]QLG11615.1 hypothetical protein HLB42_13105 [Deinococcus sp. D7000]TNM72609.1 hypothetical protein FHR04_01905 [Deinococcus radiopugnans ATCC 19172]
MSRKPARLSFELALQLRLLSAAGALLIFTLLFAGFIYPSGITLPALLVTPALFVLLAAVISPQFVEVRPWLRNYLLFSVGLAVVSWVFIFVWFSRT